MQPSPNLFAALFDFHPRDGHTPRENFLTEAFAYLLQTDAAVRDCWLSKLLGRMVKGAICDVRTRQTETDMDAGTSIYPDLLLDGQLHDGEKFAVYCEHKWDSKCDENQLRKYRRVAENRGKHARLSFIGANQRQRNEARECFQDRGCGCFLWEDVYLALDSIATKSTILMEFLEFMKTHGLSPGEPLTVERMTAFLQAAGFEKSLSNFANKLHKNYSWDAIPRRFRGIANVQDRWGRIGIRFETPDWKPALTVGFLYDESDHQVTLVNRQKGIDLMLRIEAEPSDTKNIQPALAALEAKRKQLKKSAASVLLKGERGNGNGYSVLIVRDCLGDVIQNAKTESEQLFTIHGRLTTWLEVLFKDGSLEKAFKQSALDSGMK